MKLSNKFFSELITQATLISPQVRKVYNSILMRLVENGGMGTGGQVRDYVKHPYEIVGIKERTFLATQTALRR